MVTDALERLLTGGEAEIGELRLKRVGNAVRIAGPGRGGRVEVLAPEAEAVRERMKTDDRGRYRPLSGAGTLPGDWETVAPSVAAAAEVVEAIYPLALVHMAAAGRGELRCVGLDDVLARQSGRYEVTDRLSGAGREAVADVLCGRCVREPAWREEAKPGGIPCPEPCSVVVALAREAALWQEEMPAAAEVDPELAFAAFEEPGNEVREELLARLRRLEG